jgi:hypothetical protein
MKAGRKILIAFGLAIVLCSIVYLSIHKGFYHSTVTSGQVISKEYNPDLELRYTFRLKVLSDNTPTGTDTVLIAVRETEIWNTIQEGKFYFVNYQWRDGRIPVLYQIGDDYEFGEIYGDRFK